MHEMSLVTALLEQATRHVPDGAVVRKVKVCAGAMRAIEPELMMFAWEAGKGGTPLASADLELTIERYELRCPDCGRCWHSERAIEKCSCGSDEATPGGGDELLLMALEIDEM